ncbi:tRNA1(Val) (adenine(37)-N6)-methyltransferase [Geothrix fermentans]|jgi:tRNA1(Val) A37 N6-methylase TrmN6|uniref:tRNA1(Val) (adenine(37)-N6)-methyltransferase n=1 Tax=Geothrix fermentans TaxID=44676 RepID=UPI000429808E|nr:SAM-dependent methyltransferase [Geothrix fermentans]
MPRRSLSNDAASYKGWVRPGPVPPGGVGLEPGETLDGLCGHWRIFQLEKGNRFSVDDLVTAWYGTTWCPRPGRIADLGSGIGSVALVTAWRCPGAVVHTVEAQEESLRLARKSIRYNGQEGRIFPRLGDLRDPALFEGEPPFDLVTGTPPYWPEGHRLPAAHPQSVPARLEVRGSIADYAQAAARLLAPGGIFACVFPNDQRERALAALREAGLLCLHRREIVFKADEPYGLDVFAAGRRQDYPAEFGLRAECPEIEPPILIRRADGSVDPAIARLRLAVGFPPGL